MNIDYKFHISYSFLRFNVIQFYQVHLIVKRSELYGFSAMQKKKKLLLLLLCPTFDLLCLCRLGLCRDTVEVAALLYACDEVSQCLVRRAGDIFLLDVYVVLYVLRRLV